MGAFIRGIRNTFRNGIRTFSIIVILGLSIGLAMTMYLARVAVQDKINSVQGSIGNIVNISPAGARGSDGGGEPLTTDEINKVKALAHISSVTSTLTDRLASTDTNLQSAIDAGTLGQRQGQFNQRSFGGNSSNRSNTQANFTPPIQVIGSTDLNTLQSFGGGAINLTSGDKFDATSTDTVAIIGKGLADKNSLSVGSTFQAYGKALTVKGIFDSGNTFSNNLIVLPLATLQTLSSQSGQLSTAIATVDSINNLDSAVAAMKTTLGTAADVVSQQDTSSQALAPLENIKKISLLSLIGAAAAAAVIILLTMLMIVRERRREIGVLKAIGASNFSVIFQFMSEAITFTIIGAVVGLGLGIASSNSVINVLVNNASSAATPTGGGQGGGAAGQFLRFVGQSGSSLRNIHAVIGYQVIFYGLLAAILIAIIGSAFPAWLIAQVRPSEVMRAD